MEQWGYHSPGDMQSVGAAECKVLCYCSDKVLQPLKDSSLGMQN